MKKISLFIVGIFSLGVITSAQQVSGVIKDQQGKGIDKTTVSLLNARDSSLAKLAVTQDNGNYVFTKVNKGSYVLSVSHITHIAALTRSNVKRSCQNC